MPQPCILLKIQHIHYGFTWGKKVKLSSASRAVPITDAGMCTWMKIPDLQPGPCLITGVTDHSSLSCKITTARPFLSCNTSRKLQGNIWKSSCQLEIPFQPEMSISKTGRVWSSLCTSREGRGARDHPSPDSQHWWELQWWILKGKLCILKLCDLQL